MNSNTIISYKGIINIFLRTYSISDPRKLKIIKTMTAAECSMVCIVSIYNSQHRLHPNKIHQLIFDERKERKKNEFIARANKGILLKKEICRLVGIADHNCRIMI